MAIPAPRREVSLGISRSNSSNFLFIIIIFHNEDRRDVQQLTLSRALQLTPPSHRSLMGRSRTTFVDGAKWFGRRVRSRKQQQSGWEGEGVGEEGEEEEEEEGEEKTRRGNHGQRPVAVSRPSP